MLDEENSEGESSFKRMKGKSKFSREDEGFMVKKGLDNVTSATKICAAEIEKLNQKLIYIRIWDWEIDRRIGYSRLQLWVAHIFSS